MVDKLTAKSPRTGLAVVDAGGAWSTPAPAPGLRDPSLVGADGDRAPALVLDRLGDICTATGEAVVAVSGGVDSMTLAVVAGRVLGPRFTAFHAVSPAVPPVATARVRDYGARYGWRLQIIDAREFEDASYLANPHNRCYFCKRNLYQRIAEHTDIQVFSGANRDDLGDYRPGLVAAAERQVRHPYIEAGVSKAGVRALAAHLGLTEVQALPAMPCLSSRVESGIAIDALDLAFVNDVEERLREGLEAETARCRIGHSGVRIELDSAAIARLESPAGKRLAGELEALCRASARPFEGFTRYRRGSAFLVPPAR